MIIDGKQIAEEVLQALAEERKSFGDLTLGIVMNKGDAASQSFVMMKERVAQKIGVTIKRFSPDHLAEALMCDGVLVQLPIENAEVLLTQIPLAKDVDALAPNTTVVAPVALAVAQVLDRSNVDPKNKKVVVVGEGKLVGKPVAQLFHTMGANVHVVSLEQGDIGDLKDADIVVSGAGSPGLIKSEMLKPGVVLIDAGTSEQAGKVVGDCDPSCAEVASVFTPVPGGIGPIAVAMIFKNLLTLVRVAKQQ